MRVLTLILLVAGAFLAVADNTERDVWLVDLDGPVGPATADLVIRSIDDAANADAAAIIIRIDTPGGLDRAMRDIVKAVLAARIPVITYVSPDGARAASAGTYIVYASHVAAMAPATNIGSSTPVSIGGPPTTVPDDDSDGNEAPAADAMTRKIVNDAVAYLQSLAELRGRNVEWAEETVRKGANLRASEALKANVVDVVADDLDELLLQLDGKPVEVDGETVMLVTAGATIATVEPDWRHELLSIITDPSIAYALLLVGFYGLILEFYNPGVIFPAVLGVICLLLGAYGLQMLPINYVGLALLVVGIGLMIAEAFAPSFGVLGLGGIAAFILGSIMLFDSDLPDYSLPIPIVAGFAIATGLLVFLAVGAAVRARRSRIVSGIEGMIGGEGKALEDFESSGRVWAFGENWQASSGQPVRKGERVRVLSVEGLELTVEPIQEED